MGAIAPLAPQTTLTEFERQQIGIETNTRGITLDIICMHVELERQKYLNPLNNQQEKTAITSMLKTTRMRCNGINTHSR